MILDSKTLIIIWITAIATFALSAVYIIPQDTRINAPGELGEVFFATGCILFCVLALFSLITYVLKKK